MKNLTQSLLAPINIPFTKLEVRLLLFLLTADKKKLK